MATITTYKVLGQSAPVATTLTDLYTVPGATMTVQSSITACNTSSTATSFRLAVRVAGATIDNSHYIYYDEPLAGNSTFTLTLGITLATTDVVSVYATDATVSFNMFGAEYTET